MDSNHDKGLQRALCYRYTIGQHAGHNIHWESAASPLIEGDLVFVAGGGPGRSAPGVR
jgi:hypothetical protein